MPGPGSKKSNKTKKRTSAAPASASCSTTTVLEPYVGEIESVEAWNQVINILCDYYKVPDLTSRAGLKRVHSNFDAIYRRLDGAYTTYANNDKVRGAIVGIFSKMCADKLLMDKLFQRHYLSKVVPLLDKPTTRHLALRSLSSVAHHGSDSSHLELAQLTPTLMKLLKDHPEDPTISEIVITILSHSLVAIQSKIDTRLTNQPQTAVLHSINMDGVLKLVTEQMKKPDASQYLVDHGARLVSISALYCSKAVLANTSAVHFLVAGLRSKEWELRCTCLNGLIRLFRLNAEDDIRSLDPAVFLNAVQRRVPDNIIDVLFDYGQPRTEIFMTLAASRDFQNALMQVAQTRDLHSFGLALSDLIIRTEFSIGDGYFETVNPDTGKREYVDTGLPFKYYSEALPQCAKVLRAKGALDKADVLDIKFFIMKTRVAEAAELAKKSLERNPQFAYYHYAISLRGDPTVGLRSAKKGLRCKETTPFIRFQLLQRAVVHAGELGVQTLEDASGASDPKWEVGIAFLMSSLQDSKLYIAEAPPDNRHMRNVLYWNILLTIVIQGPEISPNLKEVQASLQKLKQSDDITRYLNVAIPKTHMRLTEQAVVDKFPAAVKEWDAIITRMNETTVDHLVSPQKAEDDFAAWLDEMQPEDGESEPQRAHPKVNTNNVALYRCSYCSNPSAVLRKCSGCAMTRYCDASCQKLHWPEHKKKCKTSQ